MQDMSDHEFDALFRKAAENLEVPYNPKGWKRMQSLLNKADSTGYIRRGLWGLSALLLLLGTAWWLSEAGIGGVQDTTLIELSFAHQVTVKEQVPPLPEVNIFSEEPALERTNQQLMEEGKEVENKEAEAQEVVAQAENNSESESDRIIYAEDIHSSIGLNIAAMQEWDEIYLLQSLGIGQEAWALQAQELEQLSMVKAAYPKKAPQEVVKPDQPTAANRWGLSFGLSPDLSGIGLQKIRHVGTKANVQLEFFVLPNVSINSGVNFAVKTYSASPEDYHQKYQYNRKPVGINGQCQVLDIPLNIRWYALGKKRSRLFISGGLSSYMMLKEDYEYVYKKESGYGEYSRNYEYKNENNHLFKVANFSVGYERTLGRHWAVQAEPFVKLPLAGVGEGEIKLSTIGAFMSVYYRWGMR